ncbi:glycosyltransferase family 4 protein [Paenibacillus etheri]|uniref:Glycosyltransferase WbuB n=1 Tax=Paenibacillus etheri TaxID=1306852 RepID=A0A0W1B4C1_9BACL|nr:glycosyltransferase family 4 protein [Paenibacillus etheri]KTD88406.1 glycosyltransferase WbuB [Paenibacillus etheri]
MKILVVCQYYYPEQFRINDICETLVSEGHDVTVLTGLPNYPKGKLYRGYSWFRKRAEIVGGVKVKRVPIFTRGKNYPKLALNYLSFIVAASIKAIFLEKDYDVVYVYQLSPVTMAIPAILYKKINKTKLALYCLDIWPESIAAAGIDHSSFMYRYLLELSRKIYKSADVISVTSQSFMNYLTDVIGLDNNHLIYQPQYAEELFLSRNLEHDKSINNLEMNLVFAGNIGEMQSVDTIIRAAHELRDIKTIKWHIIGDGSAKLKCEELVNELKLNEIVIFYGKRSVEEMPGFYSKASAFLVTLNKNENISRTLPGKVQSYMAFGKPIIGAIDGETRRVILESGCGLCCEAENYKGLADIIREFIWEPTMIVEYGEKSRIYYERNFSKQNFMNSLIHQLNKLTKR